MQIRKSCKNNITETNDRLFLLALNRVDFLNPTEKLSLCRTLGRAEQIFGFSQTELSHYLGRNIKSKRWIPEMYIRQAERDVKYLTDGQIRCIFCGDEEYPPLLEKIHDPPLVLFYRGVLPDYRRPGIAVVGTRRPTGKARYAAYRLGFELSKTEVYVISGLARGIDAEAHIGSVDAGGRAVAVLGSGIDVIYPRSNLGLARKILMSGGVIFSEFSPGTPPCRHHFPGRNRIIAGLASGTVIVQAPRKSGALITADYALDNGRDLFVHKDGLGEPAGIGSRTLVEAGAQVVGAAKDVPVELNMDTSQYRESQTELQSGARAGLTYADRTVSDRTYPDRDHSYREGPGRRLAGQLEREMVENFREYRGDFAEKKTDVNCES